MTRVIDIPAFDRPFFGLFVAALVEAAAQGKLNASMGRALLLRLLFEPDATGQPIKNAITDAFTTQIAECSPGAFLDTVYAYMDQATQAAVAKHFSAHPADQRLLVDVFASFQAELRAQWAELAQAGKVPKLRLVAA